MFIVNFDFALVQRFPVIG